MTQPAGPQSTFKAAADDGHPETLELELQLDDAAVAATSSAPAAAAAASSAAVHSISSAISSNNTSVSVVESSSSASGGATMQLQGTDGSQISIPSCVVNRRPPDGSIQQKAFARIAIGGMEQEAYHPPRHHKPEQRQSTSSSTACKRSSSSSPTNSATACTSASTTSTTDAASSRRTSTSSKRSKLEDDEDIGACTAAAPGDEKSSCSSDSSSSKPAAVPPPPPDQGQPQGDMLSSHEDTVEGGSRPTTHVSSASITQEATATATAAAAATTSTSSSAVADLSSSTSLPPPSSSSSSSWRTDGTKPKRPMTAYNYFFREQRNLIKSLGLESYRTMMEGGKGSKKGSSRDSNNNSGVESSEEGASSSNEDTSATTTTATTTTTTTTTNSDLPTSHAKDTTKPSLQVLAKTVAYYWKRVSSPDLRRYQELARQEQKRYRSEMKEYKAMLRDRQEQLGRQREQQSLAAANAAASAAAWGLGLGHHLASGAATAASSYSWTPEQMASIFGYLNQAQMEQPPPNSTNVSQEQQLIFNAQNAMIGQLQDQIRSMQETSPNGPTTTIQEAQTSSLSSSTTTKGKSKTPASSRGILGRLEAQASLMRLQIERGKARSLGAANSATGEQLVEQTAEPGADEGPNLFTSFPNSASTQTYPYPFVGDTTCNQDLSLGSASGAAISLFTQPPTTGAQASLPTATLNPDNFQECPPFAAPSSNPTHSQGWASANPLSGMPSVPMESFPQEHPLPTQKNASLPSQQLLQPTVSTNGMGQQAQYQSQRSSISALSDLPSNAESADEGSSSEETLDAFSIAQMLFGPGSGKHSAN